MILRMENKKKPGLVLHVLCLSLKQASPARGGTKPPWSFLDIDFLRLPEKERSDWSSIARNEVRLSKVNRRWRGTRYDSSKLIVSEVEVNLKSEVKVKVNPKRSFIFPETYIYHRSWIDLKPYLN